jgi:hypothetical protein
MTQQPAAGRYGVGNAAGHRLGGGEALVSSGLPVAVVM